MKNNTKKEQIPCPHCEGMGEIEVYYISRSIWSSCSECNGTGKVDSKELEEKNSTKTVEEKRIVELSTTHITEKDGNLLLIHKCNNVEPAYIFPNDHGAFIIVPGIEEDEIKDTFSELGYSEIFSKVVLWAKEKKFDYIRLDSDAQEIDELEKFHW